MGVGYWDQKLHSPMYFFICIFSFLEICYTTVTMPRLLRDLVSDDKIISIQFCVVQFYFLFVFGSTENFLLSTMAYDRYVAICNPLRYNSIMTHRSCVLLILGSWTGGFLAPLMPVIFLSMSFFCGSSTIDHFYCDFSPLLHHFCIADGIYMIETVFFLLACIVIIGNFVFISTSYGLVILIISKIPSPGGRRKALSTCGSHLTVVCLFYGSIIFMYVRSDHSVPTHVDKVVSLFYSVITPTLNPLIYGLRNKEIKQALRRAVKIIFLRKPTFQV
ncbi:olfactory receptor 11G2-like [Hyla sarda]|uniref:olfactory receptor 11G2-like n=1 Tax=Hyla sarda TaxID=327740 RepID=UPI0024C2BDE4|nr:olfactory receptor 11G2-like [Hyla sarda]